MFSYVLAFLHLHLSKKLRGKLKIFLFFLSVNICTKLIVYRQHWSSKSCKWNHSRGCQLRDKCAKSWLSRQIYNKMSFQINSTHNIMSHLVAKAAGNSYLISSYSCWVPDISLHSTKCLQKSSTNISILSIHMILCMSPDSLWQEILGHEEKWTVSLVQFLKQKISEYIC